MLIVLTENLLNFEGFSIGVLAAFVFWWILYIVFSEFVGVFHGFSEVSGGFDFHVLFLFFILSFWFVEIPLGAMASL